MNGARIHKRRSCQSHGEQGEGGGEMGGVERGCPSTWKTWWWRMREYVLSTLQGNLLNLGGRGGILFSPHPIQPETEQKCVELLKVGKARVHCLLQPPCIAYITLTLTLYATPPLPAARSSSSPSGKKRYARQNGSIWMFLDLLLKESDRKAENAPSTAAFIREARKKLMQAGTEIILLRSFSPRCGTP